MVKRLVKVPLTSNQFSALVSLVFNIGSGNFSASTVLRKLNKKDYPGSSEAFDMWVKQTNPKTRKRETLQGLVRRRKVERKLFESNCSVVNGKFWET